MVAWQGLKLHPSGYVFGLDEGQGPLTAENPEKRPSAESMMRCGRSPAEHA